MRSGKFKTQNPKPALQLGAGALLQETSAEGPAHEQVSASADQEPRLCAADRGCGDGASPSSQLPAGMLPGPGQVT